MKERVLQFIEYTGLNKASFEKMVGLSNGAVDKMGANTRHSTVDKISKTFPEINRDWLMTGKGNMLNEGASNNGVVEISAEAWNVIKKQADRPSGRRAYFYFEKSQCPGGRQCRLCRCRIIRVGNELIKTPLY